ncbi:hypothetical protein [Streptomyces qaidamensis]|uniref:hypothetical protein n=1 Tax=Streptomyces qaidamensis TaxID=1783515 RepID=UPI00131E4F4A|nr:hypothetical protein [Streptomyces qaidamensis]
MAARVQPLSPVCGAAAVCEDGAYEYWEDWEYCDWEYCDWDWRELLDVLGG